MVHQKRLLLFYGRGFLVGYRHGFLRKMKAVEDEREREREREREIIINIKRVNGSFLLILVMCVAHDLVPVSLFLFDTCPCMQQMLQSCVHEILVYGQLPFLFPCNHLIRKQ